MANIDVEEITNRTLAGLSGTPYACSSLEVLSGGTANFLYKGTLINALEDGTMHVVVKHAEAFVKNNPAFPLSIDRCRFEETALEAVQTGLGPVAEGNFNVETPRLLSYNQETNTQVQEYAPGTLNLKAYALKFWSPSSTPDAKSECQALGRGLGLWLRKFHEWTDLPEQKSLRDTVKQNLGMQKLKHMINYPNSLATAQKYPSIFDESCTSIMKEVAGMAQKELLDGDGNKLGVIHGDFWTGNALVPGNPFKSDSVVPVHIIDWELVQMGVRPLDLGQMIAELLELKLFKDIDAGIWILEGFAKGYGVVDDEFAFRVAIHVGAHLINFSGVPGWGSQEQTEGVIEKGRDIVVNAWKKNRSWFEGMELSCLFGSK